MAGRFQSWSWLSAVARALLCFAFVYPITGSSDILDAPANSSFSLAALARFTVMAILAAGTAMVVTKRRSELGAVLLLCIVAVSLLMNRGDIDTDGERLEAAKSISIAGGLLLVIDQDRQNRHDTGGSLTPTQYH